MRLLDALLARLLRGAARALPAGVPVLDLHGLGVQDALAACERFLADAAAEGTPEVRIVYGKGRHSAGGRGVLREVVPRWLDGPGRRFVAGAEPEPDARGEDGAIRVRLRSADPDATDRS